MFFSHYPLTNKQITLKTYLHLLLAPLLLFSCGPSKVARQDSSQSLSSRLPTNSPESQYANSLLADCNGVTNSSLEIDIQLSSYYLPGTSQISTDLVKMNWSQISGKIINTDTNYLQMFRWYEDTPGKRITNQTPVKFYFQNKISGKLINENDPQDRISKAVIQNMVIKAKNGGAYSNLSPANFFQTHIVLLTGMDLQFDAITVAFYNSQQNNQSIGWQDILLPPFYAHPQVYLSTHASSSLQQLHPNWNNRQNNWSEQDFFNQTEKFCQKFF